ncbi:MAG: transcription termination factor Rho [PVC group bacterium]|nr:transcription termination factor Rho [PVC group bacterium]
MSTRRVASADEKKFIAGTAVDPHPRIILEKGSDDLSVRALDLICPIGMGQRALVVSSPGLGKTTFLKNICHAVSNGYPEMKVYCVLVDERPEEVTDFTRSVNANVYSSSIDHSHESHIKIVDTVMLEAFKEAVAGHNVMILLDSLTRLARVHNTQHRGSGRTLSGGVDAGALEVPRRIFGAARNVEGLGSITIIATILVDTGSCMDNVIFEEFKGTGNMELVLSKQLAANRVFPAIDVLKSGTRRAELLFEPEEYRRLELLRRGMAMANSVSAMEKLIDLLGKYPNNSDLLESFKDFKIS